MFVSVDDVRDCLPGVLEGEDIDALISVCCQDAETEILQKLTPFYSKSQIFSAPSCALAGKYLASADYLAVSVSAGQEYGEPRLAEYYRGRAIDIVNAIINGDPLLDSDGQQIIADPIAAIAAKGRIVKYG